MSAYRDFLGAPRPHVRRAPRSLPLFVSDWKDLYRVHLAAREPGDEARLVLNLTDQAGEVHTCADCGDYHECSCEEFRRDGFDCRHLQALVGHGVFGQLTRWGASVAPARGGVS